MLTTRRNQRPAARPPGRPPHRPLDSVLALVALVFIWRRGRQIGRAVVVEVTAARLLMSRWAFQSGRPCCGGHGGRVHRTSHRASVAPPPSPGRAVRLPDQSLTFEAVASTSRKGAES